MALLLVCNQFSVAKTKTSCLDLEAINMGPQRQTKGLPELGYSNSTSSQTSRDLFKPNSVVELMVLKLMD